MMLNHAGLPLERDADSIRRWRTGMRTLATQKNVAAKISGLGMFDHQWTVESIRPFVLDTIEIFGTDRCMFASNFPVDRLSSDYDKIWNAFDRITADFSEGRAPGPVPRQRRAVLRSVAARSNAGGIRKIPLGGSWVMQIPSEDEAARKLRIEFCTELLRDFDGAKAAMRAEGREREQGAGVRRHLHRHQDRDLESGTRTASPVVTTI